MAKSSHKRKSPGPATTPPAKNSKTASPRSSSGSSQVGRPPFSRFPRVSLCCSVMSPRLCFLPCLSDVLDVAVLAPFAGLGVGFVPEAFLPFVMLVRLACRLCGCAGASCLLLGTWFVGGFFFVAHAGVRTI